MEKSPHPDYYNPTPPPIVNQYAFEVMQRGLHLRESILGLDALLSSIKREDIADKLSHIVQNEQFKGHLLPSKVSGNLEYAGGIYLNHILSSENQLDILNVFAFGALISLGDELKKRKDKFPRSPIFELIRHLRNAAAHGRVFDIRQSNDLTSFPAYYGYGSPERFEISANLDKTQLEDFVSVGDIADIIGQAASHAEAIAYARTLLHT
jgi:hypothetical protein